MAYTVKTIRTTWENLSTDVKTYLDSASPTNIYSINIVRQSEIYRVIITHD